MELARDLAIPLRHYHDRIRYCGDFYGQTDDGAALTGRISVDALIHIVAALPFGCTELGCHPGFAGDLKTMYSTQRAQEVDVLCDPRLRCALDTLNVKLCSFTTMPVDR
jgi:predicted glycoside hydrolase/deacetylase ChbG (UPF0249 family)